MALLAMAPRDRQPPRKALPGPRNPLRWHDTLVVSPLTTQALYNRTHLLSLARWAILQPQLVKPGHLLGRSRPPTYQLADVLRKLRSCTRGLSLLTVGEATDEYSAADGAGLGSNAGSDQIRRSLPTTYCRDPSRAYVSLGANWPWASANRTMTVLNRRSDGLLAPSLPGMSESLDQCALCLPQSVVRPSLRPGLRSLTG